MAYDLSGREADRLFQALADGTRRAVVERLRDGEASVTELSRPHGMALSSFLKHLRVLEGAGLVRTAKRGRVRLCTLDGRRLEAAEAWMARQRRGWEGRVERLARMAEGGAGNADGGIG